MLLCPYRMRRCLTRFFAAPEIGSVPPRSLRQFVLLAVACVGGMLPISNMAMLSSSYLALSGDFNADLIDLARLSLGNLLIMGLVQPLINYIHAGLGLRGGLSLALLVLSVAGTGAALSGSLTEMTLWYALAGFGGGLFLSLSARIIFVIVPPESRRLIVAIWSFFIGLGSNASPLLGGFLVEFLTWHSLFLLSPLIALPCLLVVFFMLPDTRPSGLPPFDWCSFVFLVLFAVPTLIIVCYGQTYGWNSTFILCMMFWAASALFLFLVSCLSAEAPLLHLGNLRMKGVGLAVAAAILLVLSHVGMRIQMILFMRNVLGYPPSQIGLMFLLPLCVFVVTVIPTGITVARHGTPKPFLLSGIACIAAAGVLLSRLDANADWLHMAGPLALRSFGYALGSASATPFLLRNVSPEKQPQTLPVINCVRFFCMCTCMGTITTLSVLLNKWYFAQIAAQVTQRSSVASATIARWASLFAGQGLSAAQSRHDALVIVSSSIRKQASVFTFDHLFLLFSATACVAFLCALFSRRVNPHPHTKTHIRRSVLMRLLTRMAVRLRRFRPAYPVVGTLLCLLLAGCTLGPDYKRPALELPAEAADQPGPLFTAERWWEVFRDPALDRLEEAALEHNNNLAQAMARVEAAAAAAGVAFADRLPSVGLKSRDGKRQMTEGEALTHHYASRTQESYAETAFLSFEVDLWGKYRRLDEAARAELLATKAARDTIRLSVTSETALEYFRLRTLEEQRRIVSGMLQAYERTCMVYETRYRLGQSPETTLRRFAAERDKTQAQLYELEDRLVRCEGALAVLVGFSPARIIEDADAFREGRSLNELAPPPDVPSGIPSDLLQRRPDVYAAEAKLQAANARIGAARADFFPSFSLTAEGGFSSTHLDRVFMDPSRIWSLVGGLTQPLFEGGRLSAKERLAEARYDEARAAYMLSVQNAFRETRDALAGNRISRNVLAAGTEQVKELARSNEIMEKQYDAGLSSVMDLLDVRRQLLAARQEQAEARRLQLVAVVQLCKALGGGWTERAVSGSGAVAPVREVRPL